MKEKNAQTFALRIKGIEDNIEGAIQIRIENEMLIMDVIEIAPHNIGTKNKRFDFVAGCLISFACRESFKLASEYKGFLTFISKTSLIGWYSAKYKAEQALGQKMFIDTSNGLELIEEYLNRVK